MNNVQNHIKKPVRFSKRQITYDDLNIKYVDNLNLIYKLHQTPTSFHKGDNPVFI